MITGAVHWAERSCGQFSCVAAQSSSGGGDRSMAPRSGKLQWHKLRGCVPSHKLTANRRCGKHRESN